ncbi:MAG: U32 family peptidase [Streptococcaceae bacterium]|nr:U32 family peptidase [Streptococcaceae bacterium]
MFKLTATAESVQQARMLMEAGVDRIVIGEKEYGLRLPHAFSREEIKQLSNEAHLASKELVVNVAAIMHPQKMRGIQSYLAFLQDSQVDFIVVGDTGLIHVLTRDDAFNLPFIYDASTLVTNSRQINFWGKVGAKEAVLAREVPFEEMKAMQGKLAIPVEVLVYGATAIHQSKRPLLQNYYNFIEKEEQKGKDRGLFLREPKEKDTHYSIYEDEHGTHIFANNDINLMMQLNNLADAGYTHWNLDGIFTPGENFVEIAKLFVEARDLIKAGTFDHGKSSLLDSKIRTLHPSTRGIDEGFFRLDPKSIV